MQENLPSIWLLVGFLDELKKERNNEREEDNSNVSEQSFRIEREFLLVLSIWEMKEDYKGSKHKAVLTDGKITTHAYFKLNSNQNIDFINGLKENQLIRVISGDLTINGEDLELVINEFQKFITEECCKHSIAIKLETNEIANFQYHSPSRK